MHVPKLLCRFSGNRTTVDGAMLSFSSSLLAIGSVNGGWSFETNGSVRTTGSVAPVGTVTLRSIGLRGDKLSMAIGDEVKTKPGSVVISSWTEK